MKLAEDNYRHKGMRQQMVKQLSGKNMRKLQKKMGRMGGGGGFPGFGGGFPGLF